MFKYCFFSLIVLLFVGCRNDCREKLESIDNLISLDKDESAQNKIDSLNINTITRDEDKAYYYMLKTQLLFRSDVVIDNDTMIDYSISYYKRKNDRLFLSRSYYFKGRNAYKQGNVKKAVACLKKAEQYSDGIDDNILKGRIMLTLAVWNHDAAENNTALSYCRKAIEYAMKSEYRELTAFCLNNMAAFYCSIGKKDSATYYANKCIPLLYSVSRKNRSGLLANIAAAYEDVDDEKSVNFARKSLEISPRDNTYRLMAAYYLKKGKFDYAEDCWNKGLAICEDLHTEINILNDMREYRLSQGHHLEAAQLANKVIVLSDSLQHEWERDSIKAVQTAYDAEEEIGTAKGSAEKAWIFIVFLVAGAVVSAIFVIKKSAKVRNVISGYQKKIDDAVHTVEMQKRRIHGLETKEREREKKMLKLKEDSRKELDKQARLAVGLQKRTEEQYSLGCRKYEEIRNGGRMLLWTKSDREAFVVFYKTVHVDFADRINDRYVTLSISQTIYLILCDMAMSDEDIMQIMGMTRGAFYTMKSRLRTNIDK